MRTSSFLLPLLVSVFVGFVIIAPQLVFIGQSGADYRGIYMFNTDAELHYLARMQAAVKGDGIGNPFVIDGRDDVPSGFFSYSEKILALPARMLPIDIPTLNLLYKFLLPAVLAFVMYVLIVALTGGSSWTIVGAVSVVLGVTVFNLGTLLNVLTGKLVYQQFLLYSRPVSPILYVIFLFGYLYVLFVKTPSRTRLLLLVLLYGLSWYLFIYLATFLTALLFSVILWHGMRREKRLVVEYGLVSIVGLITAIPAILNLHAITQSPYYYLFVGPIGLEHTHAPYLHIPLLIIALVTGWYSYTHRSYRHLKETFVLLLTSLIVMNQQVITGLSLHPAHYVTYFCMPVYILVMTLLLSEWLQPVSLRARRAVQVAIMLYAFVTAVFILYSSYVYWAPKTMLLQRDAAPMVWLSEHTPPESVVMANPTLSLLIPVYTSDNVMWETHANTYLMPQTRWDFTPENALASKDFCTFIKQYQMDYVVWDWRMDPDWSLKKRLCLQLIGDVKGGFFFYKVLR